MLENRNHEKLPPRRGETGLAEGCRLKTQCSRKGSFEEGTQKNNRGARLILRQTTPYGVQFFFKQNPPGPSAGFYGFSVN